MDNYPPIVALVLARSGSSLKDKNIATVAGHPLLSYPISAAKRSVTVGKVFLSSDSQEYLSIGELYGAEPLMRSGNLASDDAKGCDVVKDALFSIRASGLDPEIVIVLHGNSGSVLTDDVNTAIEILANDESITAAVPAKRALDFHPFRAKKLTEDGFAQNFFELPGSTSSNRQDLPPAVFFEHSFWALRSSGIEKQDGEPPWRCHGNRVKAIIGPEKPPDVHSQEDLLYLESWIVRNQVPEPRRRRP